MPYKDPEQQRAWRKAHPRPYQRTAGKAAREKEWRATHTEHVRHYLQDWQPRGNAALPVGRRALLPEQVRSIRKQRAAGVSRRALAVEYGVSYNTIRRIDAGVTYLEQEYQCL